MLTDRRFDANPTFFLPNLCLRGFTCCGSAPVASIPVRQKTWHNGGLIIKRAGVVEPLHSIHRFRSSIKNHSAPLPQPDTENPKSNAGAPSRKRYWSEGTWANFADLPNPGKRNVEVLLSENAPSATVGRAVCLFARKVWNGSEDRYCDSAWEMRELTDLHCFPGVPF